ncbi:MAG: hypothetical protein MK364_02895, partial [Pirellulales bacterium]|nr:hypothetical protein [Pirellulales bacterium]
MRHDLLGYLLGALDADERVAIEQQLKIDPQLREQLREYQARLCLLGMSDQDRDPPGGLAERTVHAMAPGDGDSHATPAFRPDLGMERGGEASSG